MSAPAQSDRGDAWMVEGGTDSAEATRALAGELAAVCQAGDLVLLVGGLGAGKTTFAQGFARALGVSGPVTSPTFTLVRQYRCGGAHGIERLLHADLYRLDTLGEVTDLGLLEQLEEGAVALVEWGDAGAPVLGADALVVELVRSDGPEGPDGDRANGAPTPSAEQVGGDERRRVRVVGRGPSWASRRPAVAGALAGRRPPGTAGGD